jgi:predicted AlkP superfamily pyrophosphatase or phosphodiesterase
LRRLILTLLLALALAPAIAARAAERAPLILVSIDGFRADYLDRGLSPNLAALAARGVRAERMIPSFPSITFPNHYTLVTGLYPDHHGIIANSFEDPTVGPTPFRMTSKEQAWWDQAQPIWITAERQGVKTGLMFWPGSEVAFDGVYASHWAPYDRTVPAEARVDRVLSWLDLPPGQRPGFFTLYFEAVDSAGHAAGPDSPEVNQAIGVVDRAIGRLVEGLKARGLAANLIVVADHGMAAVPPGHVFLLDRLVHASAIHVVFQDAVAGIDLARTPAGRAAHDELTKPHEHFACWDKGKVPARFHYGANPRVPDVVCLAETGWLIEAREDPRRSPPRGEHGYDNQDPKMGALFIAAGPAFRQGAVIAPFPNVDVYPLMADLLGLTPRPNDGRLADLEPILAK